MHPVWRRFSRLQFAVASNGDFKLELFPLHSPLLGESLLVSFPPLINMLKIRRVALSDLRSKVRNLLLLLFRERSHELELNCFGWLLSVRTEASWAFRKQLFTIAIEFRYIESQESPSSVWSSLATKNQKCVGFTRRSDRHAPWISRERNLRSKIRWFTEFCNSHYLSQLATFFIDARAKRSTVKSCIVFTFISSVVVHLYVKRTNTRKSLTGKQ